MTDSKAQIGGGSLWFKAIDNGDGSYALDTAIRGNTTSTATIAGSAALSDVIDMTRYAGGIIHMPAAWTAASIGFKVSTTSNGTFLPLYDAEGSLMQISSPSASQAYALPSDIFPARYVKLWSQDGAGSDTTQDAQRSITIDLKA